MRAWDNKTTSQSNPSDLRFVVQRYPRINPEWKSTEESHLTRNQPSMATTTKQFKQAHDLTDVQFRYLLKGISENTGLDKTQLTQRQGSTDWILLREDLFNEAIAKKQKSKSGSIQPEILQPEDYQPEQVSSAIEIHSERRIASFQPHSSIQVSQNSIDLSHATKQAEQAVRDFKLMLDLATKQITATVADQVDLAVTQGIHQGMGEGMGKLAGIGGNPG
jgi:hypothetical protein